MKPLVTFSLLLTVLWTINSHAADQPNIIVLLADDLGYHELGCQGNTDIPTPHIDAIAANGVRFTDAYVAGPNCSPSRAGFLTGRTPTRFGYEFNPIGAVNEQPGIGMPAEEITIAEALHNGGYTTGLIGKWHQGGTAHYHPFRHGFDEFFGFTHEGHYFVPPPWDGTTTLLRRRFLPGGPTESGYWYGDKKLHFHNLLGNEPDYDANNPIVRGGQPVVETEYLTDALTREAVDFIDRHDDKPFFLFLSYNAVHSPLQGADAYMEKFAHIEDMHRRIFAAMLANMDDSVGAVMDQLRKSGLEEDTLVFFLSDNGGPTKELTSSNGVLRGQKGQMYEGGVRVPFVMQWKGTIPPAKSSPSQSAPSTSLLRQQPTPSTSPLPNKSKAWTSSPISPGRKRGALTKRCIGVRVAKPACVTVTGRLSAWAGAMNSARPNGNSTTFPRTSPRKKISLNPTRSSSKN